MKTLKNLLLMLALTSQAQAAPFAYIANTSRDNIDVLDMSTSQVAATIPVGVSPIGVAVTPDGGKVYVTNTFGNTVSVINAASNSVSDTINVGSNPLGIAISPDASKVYVANNGDNTVSVINTASNTIAATVSVTLPVGKVLQGIAVSPDGAKIYVAGGSMLTVIDAATTDTAAYTLPGFSEYGLAVTPDGAKIYLLSNAGILVFNADTNTLSTTINDYTSIVSAFLAASPDGTKIYALASNGLDLLIINSATDTMTAEPVAGLCSSLPNGAAKGGMAVSADGAHIYVVCSNDNTSSTDTVSIVDAVTFAATNTAIPKIANAVGQFIASRPHVIDRLSGLNVNKVLCQNTSTHQNAYVNLAQGTNVDCQNSGLKVKKGDRISVTATGIAQ